MYLNVRQFKRMSFNEFYRYHLAPDTWGSCIVADKTTALLSMRNQHLTIFLSHTHTYSLLFSEQGRLNK